MATNQEEMLGQMVNTPSNRPIPGLLKFKKLVINRGQITRVEEKRMESVIKTQENLIQSEIYSANFQNAARNVKAVMLYHSSRKSEAIKTWEETLTSDLTNLNALQDITLAYQKFRYDQKAKEYEEKARNLLQDSNPDEKKMMFARCKVEQGYALSQDLHTQSWRGTTVVQEQVQCYEEALKMAEGYIEEKEKRDWVLYTGRACERLCHVYFRGYQHDLYVEFIGKAIKYLHEAKQMLGDRPNRLYLSEIWLTIGNAFARVLKDVDYSPPDIVEQYYDQEWKNPMKCYKKALEYNPSNLWLRGCIGVYLCKQKAFSEAKRNLEKFINDTDQLPAEDPQKNSSWRAHYYRAKISIKEAQELRGKKQLELLQLAQRYACDAVRLKHSPMNLTMAGNVHHLLSKNPLTTPDKVKDLRNEALDKFYEASVTQDGSDISDLHLKWAQCLQDTQDLPSAIELFKIAFDSERKQNVRFCALLSSKLLCAMLQYYKELHKQQYLKEVAFWFVYSFKACKNLSQSYHIKKLLTEYKDEVSDVGAFIRSNRTDMQTIPEDLIKMISSLPTSQPEPPAIQEVDAQPGHDDNDHPLTEGVDFDVYILYEGEDPVIKGWIRYSLVTGLECKFFALQAYYHQRDSSLGELIIESTAKAMEKSAKILIVLSHDFNGEQNLSTEIAQVLQAKNKENVIVLQKETVEVPLKLKCYRRFDFTVQIDLPDLARYIMPERSSWD